MFVRPTTRTGHFLCAAEPDDDEPGDEYAQATLGFMYHVGEGVEQDFEEAVRLYEMAAEQGFGHAQYNLAVMYVRGKRWVEQDYSEATWWYRLAIGEYGLA